MAQLANVISQQTQKFNVTGDMGNTVIITTGLANASVGVNTNGQQQTQSNSYRLLVDPVLAPGQFRKATAVVSVANWWSQGAVTMVQWGITDTAASLDDESGKVEVRFDLSVVVAGNNVSAGINQISFQVTAIAAM